MAGWEDVQPHAQLVRGKNTYSLYGGAPKKPSQQNIQRVALKAQFGTSI
jgi:hypothetical protein